MPTNVGKTTATAKLSDGSVISVFNRSLQNDSSNILFKDYFGNVRYELVIPTQYVGKHYRCAHFSRFYGQSGNGNPYPNLVIYVPNITIEGATYGIPAIPLYQTISPTLFKHSQDDFMLTWWSNMEIQNGVTLSNFYSYENIKKFSSDEIDNFQEKSNVAQLLCAASVRFEKLKQVGGGLNQQQCSLIPIIYNPMIVHYIENNGYVVDFATGGGGGNGSFSNHNHTDTNQGGFAAAVFMPSATVRPLNWR